MHCQPQVKASHRGGDELPIGYKPGEEGRGESHEIRTAPKELKQKYQGYEVGQCNIIMHVLGGWCQDLEVKVGSKSEGVLNNMQKAVLSGTLNIARTFKVAI